MARKDAREQNEILGEEADVCASPLQLRLAECVINRVVERNRGCGAGDVFWENDSGEDADDREEYLDPELWDPDAVEVLPEMDIVCENIFECL